MVRQQVQTQTDILQIQLTYRLTFSRSHPVLCMASAWFRQALTTVDSPPKPSSPSAARTSAKLQTLFRASKAYRRTLKLWLKHHCRMTSSALPNCSTLITHTQRCCRHWAVTQEERRSCGEKEFTSSFSLGTMTLKCTRTDRKVQLLVLVFSWSCERKSGRLFSILPK